MKESKGQLADKVKNAVNKGDILALTKMIEDGEDIKIYVQNVIDRTTKQTDSVLGYAVSKRKRNVVKFLLDIADYIDLDINFPGQGHMSPLLLAISLKDEKTAMLLLDADADIDLVDWYGQDALIWAALGANTKRKTYEKKITALIYSVFTLQSSRLTKALLQHGADSRHRDAWGHTALDYALKFGAPSAKVLLDWGEE